MINNQLIRNKTKEIVKQILEEYPKARKDDKWLCYLVYQKICQDENQGIFIPFNLFKILPAFETISRVRRQLNEQPKELEESKTKILHGEEVQVNNSINKNDWMR